MSSTRTRTTLKRTISILLTILLLILAIPFAAAEPHDAKVLDYSFDGTTLTFSTGEGEASWEGNFFLLDEEVFLGTLSEKTESLSDIHIITIKESADQLQNKHYELGEITYSKASDGIVVFACFPEQWPSTNDPYISGFYYPSVINNYSMLSCVLVAKEHRLTRDGRKVIYGYEELCDELSNITQDEAEIVKEFNRRFGTSFSKKEECKWFVLPYETDEATGAYLPYYIAPTILYCKKGSLQQKMSDSYHLPYILLDDSTSKTDSKTGVKTTYNNTAFFSPVEVRINQVASGKKNAISYDITPMDAIGQKVQPSEAMEIRIPIPNGWAEEDLQILHTKEDGSDETIEFVVDEDEVAFYASSCSVFTLINTAGVEVPVSDQPADDQTSDDQPTDTTKPAKEDHANNLNFFQRVIQWFRNLFDRLFSIFGH